MGKLDKLISKFFDNLRQGKKDAFTKDILKDPKARQAVKNLKKQEDDLLDFIKKQYGESIKK
jgi:hypothetical protein|tara:strand:+ start:1006 stop:1191 length:186 start_codon:yes stop_codon:yes gene_type:complete